MTPKFRLILITLGLSTYPLASWACGNKSSDQITLDYRTWSFSGEAHSGQQSKIKIYEEARPGETQFRIANGDGIEFKFLPNHTGGWIMELSSHKINLIDQDDRVIDPSTLKDVEIGKTLTFSLHTLSPEASMAAAIVLSEVKSPKEEKAANAKLNKMYTGTGSLKVLDMKMGSGTRERSSIEYLKFDGSIKYPTQVFHLCD